ncbi:hypothetical protein [Ferruginibacter sp. HRS2-29]|uniref:hypothetical protein n=1 Tax=Ferruginibacter sp. HRS2-29 TaxID=2487334 RepID=UPI0020CE5E8B|nr:hypothetical protein [Ferruginibacter sp. HRS2-29]MCP9749362.1 hypothetical protein [Ferruginibacter sp. HRS2-29]
MKYKYLLLVVLWASFHTGLKAQTKPKETKIAPYKVPKMSTLLGQYKDSVVLPRQDVLKALALPLRVVDEKGVVYVVTNYQVAYKQMTVSETEDGKAIPATSLSSQRFSATPISAKWLDFLNERLKKGEEVFFFDIIAKDPKGRVMYAPNLKIISL